MIIIVIFVESELRNIKVPFFESSILRNISETNGCGLFEWSVELQLYSYTYDPYKWLSLDFFY